MFFPKKQYFCAEKIEWYEQNKTLAGADARGCNGCDVHQPHISAGTDTATCRNASANASACRRCG